MGLLVANFSISIRHVSRGRPTELVAIVATIYSQLREIFQGRGIIGVNVNELGIIVMILPI